MGNESATAHHVRAAMPDPVLGFPKPGTDEAASRATRRPGD